MNSKNITYSKQDSIILTYFILNLLQRRDFCHLHDICDQLIADIHNVGFNGDMEMSI